MSRANTAWGVSAGLGLAALGAGGLVLLSVQEEPPAPRPAVTLAALPGAGAAATAAPTARGVGATPTSTDPARPSPTQSPGRAQPPASAPGTLPPASSPPAAAGSPQHRSGAEPGTGEAAGSAEEGSRVPAPPPKHAG